VMVISSADNIVTRNI